MCKPFEINGQKDFEKPVIFSKSSKHFVKQLSQRNSHPFSESGIFDFSPLSYNGDQLVGKTFKVIMPKHFALQIVMRFTFKQFITQYKLFTTKIDKLRDVNPV